MGRHTTISWTDHTFNPWIGCTRVSEGCRNCYAETQNKFRRWTLRGTKATEGEKLWGPGAPRVRTSQANWRGPVLWDREAADIGERRRVFCASLADVFDHEAPDVWRHDLFELIQKTPNLDWLLLTKRPERALEWFGGSSGAGLSAPPLPNVWLGVTVENQEAANKRIPLLLELPAVVRFLSVEPMIGPVSLNPWLLSEHGRRHIGAEPGISWVVCGGESGADARSFFLSWARDLRDQCRRADVTFFMKQLGRWPLLDYYEFRRLTDDGFRSVGDDIFVFDEPGTVREWDTDRWGLPPPGKSFVRLKTRDLAGESPLDWPKDLRIQGWPEVRR